MGLHYQDALLFLLLFQSDPPMKIYSHLSSCQLIALSIERQHYYLIRWNMGFDLTAYEIDKEYYDKACKRFEQHSKQMQLW